MGFSEKLRRDIIKLQMFARSSDFFVIVRILLDKKGVEKMFLRLRRRLEDFHSTLVRENRATIIQCNSFI